MPDTYFYTQQNLDDGNGIRDAIIDYLKLKPGMRVADIGCGHGSYTSAMARKIGSDGVVYATDIDARALVFVESHFKKRGDASLGRLETVFVSNRRDTGLDHLPPGKLATILMINSASFHAYEDEKESLAYLQRFRRLLKPGGHLVYHRNWLQSDDMGRDESIALFRRAGFELDPEQLSMPAHIPAKSLYYSQGPREQSTPLTRGFMLIFHQPEAS